MQSDEIAIPDRTEQIGRLLARAERLLGDVETARDTPAARTRRRAGELRQTIAVLLIFTERIARETGNAPMVLRLGRDWLACWYETRLLV